MLKTVEKYIADRQLLNPAARVIVGLSGGMDSIALLDMLTLLGYQCIAAHCNFHLRGDESDRDADFVKHWCKSVDTEFTSIDFDTKQFAADRKISIEMAARELRYDWFEIIRRQYEAEAIAVAHHRNDSVETVLLNLIRGTGIKGLSGISPKNGRVVRPLLCLSRSDIARYVSERALQSVHDSSNSDDSFTRNDIRLNVIPLLEKMNPAVKDAIFRTSQNLAEVEKIYNQYIEDRKKEIFADGKIDIDQLAKTVSPSSVLYEILSPLGFNPSVINDVYNSINETAGKIFYAEKYRLIKGRNKFILDELSPEPSAQNEYFIEKKPAEITFPVHLTINFQPGEVVINKDPAFLFADADKLQFPLVLRKWRHGDWFIPFGMKGKKKLSDYFTDRKFNLKEKENVWIIESEGKIAWIVGERPDNRFKVTETTKNTVIMQLIG